LERIPPSDTTQLLGQAKSQLAAKQLSCKAELEKGDVQVDDARSVASVSSNLVTKAQSDLTKVQVALELTDKQLYAVKDGRPEAQASCAEDAELKKTQHELVSSDAAVVARMAQQMDCKALLQCGDRVQLSAHLQQLTSTLSPATRSQVLALLTKQEPVAEPAPSPCVVPEVSRCANVADGIAQLHSLLRNTAGTIGKAREASDTACHEGDATAVSKQQALRSKRMLLADKLQFAMKALNAAQTTAERRQTELSHLEGLVSSWRKDCDRTLKDLQFKVEQLGRARTQTEGLVRDCEVSEWQPGPCSAECGGGTRNVTRQIVSPPGEGGVACPALERVEECNRKACPVDCKVTPWAPWSACSLTCGGGTQTRQRGIIQPARGGMPCSATAATQLCNMQACDVDCELSDWSAWGPCSQRCGGGGAQTRTREPIVEAVGAGTCWAWDDPLRREFKPCPPTPCAPPPVTAATAVAPPGPVNLTAGFESCDAALDLVVVLDASGSVSPESFRQEQAAAAGVLQRMPNVAAAAVVYAGAASELAPLGDAGTAAAAALSAVRPTPDGSDLAQGLGAARRILLARTVNRRAAVLVFTDAADTAATRRDAAARDLREVGIRIVAVLTGKSHASALESVVTKPPYANLLTADSFAGIDTVAVARPLCPPSGVA